MTSGPQPAMEKEHSPAQWGTSLGYGEPVEPEELIAIPIFETVSKSLLEKNRGAVVRRRFKAGDIVCREGEFGSTAFYIVDGEAEVFLSTPMAHVKSGAGEGGWWHKMRARLENRKESEHKTDHRGSWIPIDAPVNLKTQRPTAQLHAGELFGEMTCMNFYPRSATVCASTDCVMLEMLRNVLDILLKNPKFKAQMDQIYRQRALDAHLRSIPAFAGLFKTHDLSQMLVADEFVQHVRETAELVRFSPGQVICKQGAIADSFYVIRIGFVRISKELAGGELVVGYLSRGNCFGEIGLLGGGVRTATCTALDHVEVVRISAEDFERLLSTSPEVRSALEAMAAERQQQNTERLQVLESIPLDDFLGQGLMEAQSLLLLDLHKCTRCDACVQACADTHDGVTRLLREGLRLDHYLVATSCRHCLDPLCMVGCPVGSIRRRQSLEIVIEDWCIGCGLCAKNCPYGNINMQPVAESAGAVTAPVPEATAAAKPGVQKTENPSAARLKAALKKKATTCDLCPDLDEPSCVYACPHDAAFRVDPRKFFAILPGSSANPR
jgi:CRP-like cAMP-binding protein